MASADLLRDAADALDKGSIPLCEPFLTEHGVTSDQALSLAGQLALGARIVAKAIESPRSPQGLAMMQTLVEGL
jgi:hypothetical protein